MYDVDTLSKIPIENLNVMLSYNEEQLTTAMQAMESAKAALNLSNKLIKQLEDEIASR